MERTNAFVVKWQTRRNGDTFPRWAHHGISMDTKQRSSLTLSLPTGPGILKTQKITFLYVETVLEDFWTHEKVQKVPQVYVYDMIDKSQHLVNTWQHCGALKFVKSAKNTFFSRPVWS